MSDNKLIDLHKVAGLFREIQTEEFAKEEAKQESEFKKTVKEMEQGVEDEISEELTAAQKKLPAGLRDAIAKKQGGSADDKDDKEKTEEEVEENINELNVPNDLEKVKAQMAKLKQMASDAQAKGDHNQAYNIERSSEMLALQKKLSKLGGDIDEEAVTEDDGDKALALKDWYQNWSKYKGMNNDPLPKGYIMSIVDTGITTDGIEAGEADKAMEIIYPGKGAEMKGDMNQGDAQAYNVDWGDYEIQKHLPITNAMKDDFISIMGNDDEETMQDAWEICSELWESQNALSDILKAAGVKPVTDADLNQAEAQPVKEAEEVKVGDVKNHDELGKIKVLKIIQKGVDNDGYETGKYLIQTGQGNKTVSHGELMGFVLINKNKKADRSGDGIYDQLLPHIKNVKAAMIRHAQEDPEEAREFIEHLDDMMNAGDVEVVDMMQPDYMDTEARDSLITYFEVSISQDPALYNKLFPGEDIKWAQGEYKDMFEGKPVEEDSETGTLQQLLKLAGLKVVTDADINQVEEYSNSPDEEYADADTQLNKMSGGINRPKAMPAVGNQGHNDLVTKLKKAYDSRDL